MISHISEILSKAIDIEKLVASHPKLFNFSKLRAFEKIELVRYNPKLFADKIDLSAIPPDDRALALINSGKKSPKLKIEFTEDELEKLSSEHYVGIVRLDFNKYIRKKIYDKLSLRFRRVIFSDNPEWVVTNSENIPKLTSTILLELAMEKPAFIDAHIDNFSDISVDSRFWVYMMSYNGKYKDIFIKNTNSCITKSDVRSVVYACPEVIKKLDKDILTNSKLTCKEWLLLANTIIDKNEAIFTDWKFSDDLIEIFKLDLMAEVLNGKSKLSTRFQNAMNNVFNTKEEDNEDTTMVGPAP